MFNDYYYNYLNMESGTETDNCLLCISPNRDIPLNKKYAYKFIITDYNKKRVLSASPSISDDILRKICCGLGSNSLNEILQLPVLHETGYRISMMYRMIINRDKFINYTGYNNAADYISQARKFVIRDCDSNIISYCKVSDIYCGYGNIVIWTDSRYRRCGYAKELLIRTIYMCYDEGIEPVYLADSQNIPSIELAKSVGFEKVQTEIIGCEVLS